MVYVALGIGVVALIWGWKTARQNKELKDRVTQMNRRLYNLKRTMEEFQTEVRQEKMGLNFEIMKLQGQLNVTEYMTIDEIKMLHPQAEQVLAAHHIGGCSSCSVDGSVRLDHAAAKNQQLLEPILIALNNLAADHDGNGKNTADLSKELLKMPNVQLNI